MDIRRIFAIVSRTCGGRCGVPTGLDERAAVFPVGIPSCDFSSFHLHLRFVPSPCESDVQLLVVSSCFAALDDTELDSVVFSLAPSLLLHCSYRRAASALHRRQRRKRLSAGLFSVHWCSIFVLIVCKSYHGPRCCWTKKKGHSVVKGAWA